MTTTQSKGGAVTVEKAAAENFTGRFRVTADPLNLLITRVPRAGTVSDRLVSSHNGAQKCLHT
jgi:hypothetical protein